MAISWSCRGDINIVALYKIIVSQSHQLHPSPVAHIVITNSESCLYSCANDRQMGLFSLARCMFGDASLPPVPSCTRTSPSTQAQDITRARIKLPITAFSSLFISSQSSEYLCILGGSKWGSVCVEKEDKVYALNGLKSPCKQYTHIQCDVN